MLEPLDGVPPFGEPTRAEAILARADGSGEHVPFPATRKGLLASADECARCRFPRAELSRILAEYNREIGAPDRAVENASRIARSNALVVTTGQQPMAFGGPLYVLYKAATAVRLARAAEAALGVPVVPVFWNASEDHDLDEIATATAAAPGGKLLRFRADRKPWRGGAAAMIGPDERWQRPAREWLVRLPGAEANKELAQAFAPCPDEGWRPWFSRLLSELLGSQGLVVIEPQPLRPLAREVFARAVTDRREIAALVDTAIAERADAGAEAAFAGLDGPPLFLERKGRRLRVVERNGRMVLRGTDESFAPDELARLAEAVPERFSSHAALRPVLQNALMPVIAAVLGPGEIVYHEELYRFPASALGAGRRMPVLWPRLSATVLDARACGTLERFGLAPADVFRSGKELIDRFAPGGEIAREVALAAERASAEIEALGERALAVDSTLARPLEKTARTVAGAFEKLAGKVGRAEARARGLAPEQLEELARLVRPGGRAQERALSFASVLLLSRDGFARRLVDALDVFDARHRLQQRESCAEGPDVSRVRSGRTEHPGAGEAGRRSSR